MSTSTPPRPDWVSTTEVQIEPTTTSYEVRKSKSSIITIVALSIMLALTLGLAIYAIVGMQTDIDDARTIIGQQEDQLAALDQDVTEAVADRDLAEEALSQMEWTAEQCYVVADAATSLTQSFIALDENDLIGARDWLDDTESILDRAGYETVSEAWNACDGTI